MTSPDPPGSERWAPVQRLLERALDLPAEEREAYLAEACEGDDALRNEVDAWMRACVASGEEGFLDGCAVEFAAPLLEQVERWETGDGDRQIALATLTSLLSDRYEIDREVGRGGTATVFLAHDRRHDRAVAIKVLDPRLVESASAGRFLREIRLAARMTHPNILPLHDSGDARGLLYYVMPYVEGETLRARLTRQGPLPVPEALGLLREVIGALAHAHRQGIVHRDVKPENILLLDGHAVVADFGIAQALDTALGQEGEDAGPRVERVAMETRESTVFGTPAYMAPERVTPGRTTDVRADLYSFGVMAYEMLAGANPFAAATPEATAAAQRETVPAPLRGRRPDLPPDTETLVMDLLAKDPVDRPASAEVVLERLEHGMDLSGRAARSRRWPSLVGMGALAAVGGVLTVVLFPRTAAPVADRRIAVRVCENRGTGGDPTLAQALTQEVTGKLSGIAGLRVIGQESMRRYESTTPATTIGRDLGVEYVLGCTLDWTRREDGEALVTVRSELQRAGDNTVLWTLAPDPQPVGDILALQATVADRVLDELRIGSTEAQRRERRRSPTVSLAAYQHYLTGLVRVALPTQEAREEGLRSFERAIALDSSFALAWAGLGLAWLHLTPFWDRHDSTRNLAPNSLEAYRRAEEAARRALRLDSTLVEARVVLESARFYIAWDYRAPVSALETLARHAPDDIYAQQRYRMALVAAGRFPEALASSRRAIDLDPLHPVTNTFLAVDLARMGETEEAISILRRVVGWNPDFAYAFMVLGTLQLQAGARAAGADSATRFLTLRGYPASAADKVRRALAGTGPVADAIEALDVMQGVTWEPESRLAGYYALLGERDRALVLLERAKQQHAGELLFQRSQPFFASLRGDPRFEAIWEEPLR